MSVQDECQLFQFGRPRVRTMRAGVRIGRVGRACAEARCERLSRALPAPVRPAHQSHGALRTPRLIHFELLALRGKHRHSFTVYGALISIILKC